MLIFLPKSIRQQARHIKTNKAQDNDTPIKETGLISVLLICRSTGKIKSLRYVKIILGNTIILRIRGYWVKAAGLKVEKLNIVNLKII